MSASHSDTWWALGLAALLISVGLPGVGTSGRAHAASAAAAAATVTSAPIVQSKITLSETSIDGPALWTNAPLGEPGAGAYSLIAWTGADAARHVNVMRFSMSGNTVSFTDKAILPETSIARPALTAQPSQIHPAYYFVAWTGTNGAHSLNVICDGCATNRVKLTLRNETSFAAPALAMFSGKLMLAWAGDDANHSLNLLPISITDGRLVPGVKTTLRAFNSGSGPALVSQPNHPTGEWLLLTWQDRTSHRIRTALSTTGTTWSAADQVTYTEWSRTTPDLFMYVSLDGVGQSYLGWTGTDEVRSINLLYPAYPQTASTTSATLDEAALGGPALGYIGDGRLALMWTGTDRLHHLNFAALSV
ncbi:MAG TPA: hypothetical protein VFN78_07360 [Ktedonobacterales bacterium]|nr:hypothetical protein [Ktedonobacterales bacterium]